MAEGIGSINVEAHNVLKNPPNNSKAKKGQATQLVARHLADKLQHQQSYEDRKTKLR